MKSLNNYVGIIAVAVLAIVLYSTFLKKGPDGQPSDAAQFLGL